MDVELEIEVVQFSDKEYIHGIFVAVRAQWQLPKLLRLLWQLALTSTCRKRGGGGILLEVQYLVVAWFIREEHARL